MITTFFGSKDYPRWLPPLIAEIRARHLEQGGDPADFPDYLESQGVRMIHGTLITEVSDKLKSYALLRFE